VSNALLTLCAQQTTHSDTRIDYATLATAQGTGPLAMLAASVTSAMIPLLRRQVVLQALQDRNLTNGVASWINTINGYFGMLSSISIDIRSSHSGGVFDTNLPAAHPAYDPSLPTNQPPAAAGHAEGPPTHAGLRDLANWTWLAQTTTEHTTGFYPGNKPVQEPPFVGANPVPRDANRVAAYFEIQLGTVHTTSGDISGGRMVYDPFHHRFFLSDHYESEYELIDVSPLANDASHANMLQVIGKYQTKNNGQPMQADLDALLNGVLDRMYQGKM
jgi:hypothetical protein